MVTEGRYCTTRDSSLFKPFFCSCWQSEVIFTEYFQHVDIHWNLDNLNLKVMVRIYNASNWHLSFLRAKHNVENLSCNVLELEV